MIDIDIAYIAIRDFVYNGSGNDGATSLISRRTQSGGFIPGSVNPFFEGSPRFGMLKHVIDDITVHTLSTRAISHRKREEFPKDILHIRDHLQAVSKSLGKNPKTYGLLYNGTKNYNIEEMFLILNNCSYHEFKSDSYRGKFVIFDFISHVWNYILSNGMYNGTQCILGDGDSDGEVWFASGINGETEIDSPVMITLRNLAKKESIELLLDNPKDRYIIAYEEFSGDKDQFLQDIVMSKMSYS